MPTLVTKSMQARSETNWNAPKRLHSDTYSCLCVVGCHVSTLPFVSALLDSTFHLTFSYSRKYKKISNVLVLPGRLSFRYITPRPIIIALRTYHKSSFITSTPIFVRSPIRHRLLAQSFAPVTTSRDFSRTTNSFPILDNILSFITHCISPFLHPLSFHYICGHFVYRKQHYKY